MLSVCVSYTQLLYHHILSVERKPLTTRGYPLVIDCKTFQELNLIIPRESDCLDIMDTIKEFSQPGVWGGGKGGEEG